MESRVRTAFLASEELEGRPMPGTQSDQEICNALALDTLALRTLRGFQRVNTLGRWLNFALGMRGEIAPSQDPFRRWISVDLAILAIVVFHDVPAPFACFDNGTTGSSIEATARLFHKHALHTRFNRDTFHRCVRSFLL